MIQRSAMDCFGEFEQLDTLDGGLKL